MLNDLPDMNYKKYLETARHLFDEQDFERAYEELVKAVECCPKYETTVRDEISKSLLDITHVFIQKKLMDKALRASSIALKSSVLFKQLTAQTIEYIEDYLETEHLNNAEMERYKKAVKSNDLDTVGSSTSKMAMLKRLNHHRFNPLKARLSPYLDYPNFINLETLAVCNAACTFCPYPDIERQGTRMSDGLIEKIVEDLTDIPHHIPFGIAPYKVSDPFIEKRLINIIEMVEGKLPSAKIILITNGSAMTESVLKRLSLFKNISYLKISLNDHRKDVYETLMSLPFERILERLDMLQGLINTKEFTHPVLLNRVMEGNRHDVEFMEFCRQRFPGIRATMSCRNDWIGNIQGETSTPVVPDIGCGRWKELSIIATGDVVMCCMDGHGEWVIGNAEQQNLLKIYNNERYRGLRESTKSRKQAVNPCRECTYI